MKKILFLLILICIEKALHAQTPYIYTIKADSVKITNTCDTAELIIENHTQSVPGFLFNKGRGRTEFRRISQFDDTSVVAGDDTIHLNRGDKHFGNADLTFTDDRNHNGQFQYLNLNDFGGISMKTKSAAWINSELLLDTMEGFKLSMNYVDPVPVNSNLQMYPDLLTYSAIDDYSGENSTFTMNSNRCEFETQFADNSRSWSKCNTREFGMGTFFDNGLSCRIQGGLPHDGGIELSLAVYNGVMVQNSGNSEGEKFMIQMNRADSIVMTHDEGLYRNTRYVQTKDKFIFRNAHAAYNDFRILGLPASTGTSDNLLVVDSEGQVKQRSQQSLTRKSITVTGANYVVPADIDVVFVSYAAGQATISLPTGTLDREITIKNLSTVNTVILSGLDTNESNIVATRGAITVKYTGSVWVGISKF